MISCDVKYTIYIRLKHAKPLVWPFKMDYT